MWQRWNQTTHIFEKSENSGASWVPLPLHASTITEGQIPATQLAAHGNYHSAADPVYAGVPGFGITGQNAHQYWINHTNPVHSKIWRIINWDNGASLQFESCYDDYNVRARPLILYPDGNVLIGGALYISSTPACNISWDGTWMKVNSSNYLQMIAPSAIALQCPTVYINAYGGPYFQWDGNTAHWYSPGNIQFHAGTNFTYLTYKVIFAETTGPFIHFDATDSLVVGLSGGIAYYFRGPSQAYLANSFFANPPSGIHNGNSVHPWYAVYAGSFPVTSDATMKDDIRDLDLGLAFVEKLKPRIFKYKARPNEKGHVGFTTQEVEAALESRPFAALNYPADYGHTGPTGLDYSKFVPILTKAIQELSGRLKVLEDANGR